MANEHPGKVAAVKGLGEFLDSEDGNLVSWKWFKKFIEIYRRERMLQGENTWFKSTDEGRICDVLLNDEPFPWMLTTEGVDGDGNINVRVYPATVHGIGGAVDPVIGSTPINAAAYETLHIPGTGDYLIYGEVTAHYNHPVAGGNFVTAGYPTFVEVKFVSGSVDDIPDENPSDKLHYYPIGLCQHGKVSNISRFNWELKFCDDGTANDLAVMTIGAAP